jgi:hypothetical protein
MAQSGGGSRIGMAENKEHWQSAFSPQLDCGRRAKLATTQSGSSQKAWTRVLITDPPAIADDDSWLQCVLLPLQIASESFKISN